MAVVVKGKISRNVGTARSGSGGWRVSLPIGTAGPPDATPASPQTAGSSLHPLPMWSRGYSDRHSHTADNSTSTADGGAHRRRPAPPIHSMPLPLLAARSSMWERPRPLTHSIRRCHQHRLGGPVLELGKCALINRRRVTDVVVGTRSRVHSRSMISMRLLSLPVVSGHVAEADDSTRCRLLSTPRGPSCPAGGRGATAGGRSRLYSV